MKYLPLLKRTFWVVMAIHLVVFTAIGIFTPLGWSMLYTFLTGLGVILFIYLIVRLIRRRQTPPPPSE